MVLGSDWRSLSLTLTPFGSAPFRPIASPNRNPTPNPNPLAEMGLGEMGGHPLFVILPDLNLTIFPSIRCLVSGRRSEPITILSSLC